MSDLAFHLRSGGPVVGDPVRVLLPGSRGGELFLVDADADAAPGGGRGALLTQRAPRARRAEAGGTATVGTATDRRGAPGRAGDALLLKVDLELVLAEPAAGVGRLLGLALGVDPSPFQPIMESACAVSVVTIDARAFRIVRVILT
jgi:hypothetical protein